MEELLIEIEKRLEYNQYQLEYFTTKENYSLSMSRIYLGIVGEYTELLKTIRGES